MAFKKDDLYEIGECSKVWLEEIGIHKREDFLEHTPEYIFNRIADQKERKNPKFRTVAKPLLYALRANLHYIKTGEKVPFQFWKKITE